MEQNPERGSVHTAQYPEVPLTRSEIDVHVPAAAPVALGDRPGAAVPATGMTPAVFLREARRLEGDDASELADVRAQLIRDRHAPSTQLTYDYWLGRFRLWLEDPGSRFRLRSAPAIPLDALWPIGAASEELIIMWITDMNLGPTNRDELETWQATTGPLAPSTLNGIIAAIKARSADHQEVGWSPSTPMRNSLTGLRRRLRDLYGADRQAEPLLSAHVARIAENLSAPASPPAARDRLLLELHAAGVDGGGISRLSSRSLRSPREGIATATGEANVALYAETGAVGARALVVPGRNRRGGGRDPDTVLTLAEHPALTAALEGYLRCRDADAATGDELIVLGPNRSHHIRKALARLARLAEVSWRPARDTWATPAEVRAMRAVCDDATDWAGQLRRQRDLTMVLVGYLCALRRSELCALRIADVLCEERRAIITIRKSKTDQDQRGARLAIARPDGVAAYLDGVGVVGRWVALLRDQGAGPDDPLFPSLTRHGNARRRRGVAGYDRIDDQSWSERLAELAREAEVFGPDDTGRYDNVSGHSLRRGFVTSAILAGHDPVTIAKQTRHRNVTMIARYADEIRLLEGTDWSTALFGTTAASTLDATTLEAGIGINDA